MNSYVAPTYLLRKAGLRSGDYREEFAVNPPNVAMAVFFRRAPAGGIGDIVFDIPFVREKIDVSQVMVIARSEQVAHLPWAVRGDVPPALRERIQRVLTNMKGDPDGDAILKAAALTNIVPAEDKEYNYVRRVVATVLNERY
jgi:phosphonate transport system substrate-binding protein